jgi:hypothetical protein
MISPSRERVPSAAAGKIRTQAAAPRLIVHGSTTARARTVAAMSWR